MTRVSFRLTAGAVALVAAASGAAVAAPSAHAITTDPFFTYSGSTPLSAYANGTVLNSRQLNYYVLGIPTLTQAVQLLYKTNDAQGRPVANVTTVLKPAVPNGKAVSYQSFYDSLNPEDGPSRAIAGGVSLGTLNVDVEGLFITPLLAQGYTVVVPDTEGPNADFAAGPEYGQTTLDSIIAASNDTYSTGVDPTTKVGLLGYSGGAIATNWAAALAPSYAPSVNKQLVGYAEGGLLVDPMHNLNYVSGSFEWAGIAPMAVAGAGRAYGVDFSPYLSAYGQSIVDKLQNASIANVLFQYPWLTWSQLVQPQYATPSSIPAFVDVVNKLNLGSAPNPTIPAFIGQGTAGYWAGTSGTQPGIGAGDGVMIAGDVRTLANQYCDSGTAVKYTQYDWTEHFGTVPLWAPTALSWLNDRFAGKAAPSDCGNIPAGNSLAPAVYTPAG